MISKQPRKLASAVGILSTTLVNFSYAQQPGNISTEERFRRLELRMEQYEQTIAERDARIKELEAERKGATPLSQPPPYHRN